MKDSIKKLFNEIQDLFVDKPLREKELSQVITYLFSLFRKSESSKMLFINNFKNFPDIYSYAISYMDNPNCTCRENIRAFIEKEISIGIEIFLNLVENEEEQQVIRVVNRACKSFIEKFSGEEFKLHGKVIQIENSPEAYSNILKNYNNDIRFQYRGLQIIKTEDDKFLDLYFY